MTGSDCVAGVNGSLQRCLRTTKEGRLRVERRKLTRLELEQVTSRRPVVRRTERNPFFRNKADSADRSSREDKEDHSGRTR